MIRLAKGDIIFNCPGESLSCEYAADAEGYLCLIHRDYLDNQSSYLPLMLSNFPFYSSCTKLPPLNRKQLKQLQLSFENMYSEQMSDNCAKWQAMAIYLQMIILEGRRTA